MPSLVKRKDNKLGNTSCCKCPCDFEHQEDGDIIVVCGRCREPVTIVEDLAHFTPEQKARLAEAKEKNKKAKEIRHVSKEHMHAVIVAEDVRDFAMETVMEQLKAAKEKDIMNIIRS